MYLGFISPVSVSDVLIFPGCVPDALFIFHSGCVPDVLFLQAVYLMRLWCFCTVMQRELNTLHTGVMTFC